MPSIFLELMEALKKSNCNVLELKETIDELILKDGKNQNKIKDLETENENLRNKLDKKKQGESE
jgi:hypothetical protein